MSGATAKTTTPDDFNDDIRRLLRDSVRSFAQRGGLDRSRKLRETDPGFDRAALKDMGEQGWLGITIPENFGGQGLSFAEQAIVVEELARVIAPEPVVRSAVLASQILLAGSNEKLKAELLPQLAAGEKIIGTGFQSRFGGGACVDATDVVAAAGTLKGTLYHVDPALGADDFIVAAKTGSELALYRVAANATGVSIKKQLRADGTYAGEVTLKDVKVSDADLIAKGAAAEKALRRGIDAATIMISAELLGAMDAALDMTLAYVKTRVQFGKPIGSFQALQHRAVDAWMQKELSIGSLSDALRVLDDPAAEPHQLSMAASRVKSRAGDAATLVGRESIKLHGAIGYTDEYDVGLYLRRMMVLVATLGNPAEHRRRFSRLLLAHGDGQETDEDANVPFSAAFMSEAKEDVDWNSFGDAEFRAGIRAYFEKNYPHELRHLGRRGTAAEMKDWMARMSAKGWIAPAWPREHGGMGLEPSKQLIFVEERERVGIIRNADSGVVMFGPVLMRYGTEEQKKKYLPKILSNEHIWCQGYSEPNAGSDLASLQTKAVLDGDEWVVNGSKIWTSSASQANHMFCLVRTEDTVKKQEGISFLLIELDRPGVTVRPIKNLGGYEEFCQEFLENVRVPRENLIGERGKGWTVAKALLGFERLNNGSPRRVQGPLVAAADIAKNMGIWEDGEFQAKYIKVYLDIADLGAAYRRFSDIVRTGKNPGPEISQLKIWSGEITHRVSELLIEMTGSSGALKGKQIFGDFEFNVISPFFHQFPASIASGSNEIQKNILSKRVLNLP